MRILLIIVGLFISYHSTSRSTDSLVTKGREFYQKGLYDSSKLYFQYALETIADTLQKANIEIELGTVLIDLGQYEQSSIHLYNALQVFEQRLDITHGSRTLIQIGRIQRRQKDGDKAMKTANRVLKLLSKLENAPDSADVYSLIGSIHMDKLSGAKEVGRAERKIIDQCRSSHEIALKISRDYNKTLTELNSLHYIASMHHALKENKEARTLWNQVIQIADNLGSLRFKCYATRGLGGNFAYNNECKKAIGYFYEARGLAKKIGDAKIYAHVTDNLATCYGIIGDFENAYKYEQLFAAIKDSIAQKKYNETLAKLETEYETARKEQQIQLLEQEAQLKNAELETKNTIWISSVTITIILFLFGFISYRKRQERQKLSFEKKLTELEQKALHLQMNPHFIFNSLNAIQGYISEKNHKSARKYLSKFAKLMRITLESSRQSIISLETETELLTNYLELAALRFENSFEYKINIKDIDEEVTGIPPMMIQPFVENAIIHGVVPLNSKGLIKIQFEKKNGFLRCRVSDNGIGRNKGSSTKDSSGHKSLALEITQERLNLFDSNQTDKPSLIINDIEKGTEVIIDLPIVPLW